MFLYWLRYLQLIQKLTNFELSISTSIQINIFQKLWSLVSLNPLIIAYFLN